MAMSPFFRIDGIDERWGLRPGHCRQVLRGDGSLPIQSLERLHGAAPRSARSAPARAPLPDQAARRSGPVNVSVRPSTQAHGMAAREDLWSRWTELDPTDPDKDRSRSAHREAVRTLVDDLLPQPDAWIVIPAGSGADEHLPQLGVLAAGQCFIASPVRADNGDLAFTIRRWLVEDLEIVVEEAIEFSHGAMFRKRSWSFRPANDSNEELMIATEQNMSNTQSRPNEDEAFCRALTRASGWDLRP